MIDLSQVWDKGVTEAFKKIGPVKSMSFSQREKWNDLVNVPDTQCTTDLDSIVVSKRWKTMTFFFPD